MSESLRAAQAEGPFPSRINVEEPALGHGKNQQHRKAGFKILRNFSSLRVSALRYVSIRARWRVSASFTRCEPRIEATIAERPEITRPLRHSNWLAKADPKTMHIALIAACQRLSHGRQVPPTGSRTSTNRKGATKAPL